MPGFIEPTLPTATETAPAGGGWLHEIKHDGYRLQAHLENGRVRLFSRQGLDWTERFPVVVPALAEVPAKVAINEAIELGKEFLKQEEGFRAIEQLWNLVGANLSPVAAQQLKSERMEGSCPNRRAGFPDSGANAKGKISR